MQATSKPLADASNTQTAIVQMRYGRASEVLEIRNRPVSPPGPAQVQIEVKAASINPIDWQMIEGNRRMIAKRNFPFVPLFDIAGVVTAAGKGAERFKPGDRVHCDNQIEGGGAGQVVNVDEALVCRIPDGLDYAEAAAIPLAGQTALLSLDQAGVAAGGNLVVIGASGGVGGFVVQMAKALGIARIVAVCGARNADYVRSLGADEIIDYRARQIDAALAPKSIDAVIDCVGGRAQWLAARHVLRDGGRFVTIARDEDGEVTLGAVFRLVPAVWWRQFRSRFGRRIQYLMVFLSANRTLLERVDAMVETGAVKPHIAQRFARDREGIVAALEANREGRVAGKLVVEDSTPWCG